MQNNQSILNGLKVLELASVLAGPSSGMFLAECGADVIKVENKKAGGDVTRSWKLPGENQDSGISAYFSSVNHGKRSIALDFGNESDFRFLKELVSDADVVILSMKQGDSQKFSLDYHSLIKINPEIIYAEISGYGQDDPRPAYDAVLQAETGFMHLNGPAGEGGIKMPVALIDVLAGQQLSQAILLAYIRKLKSGEGSYLNCSLFAAGVSALVNQATNYLHTGSIPQPVGSEHPNIVPYGTVFDTKGGRIVIAVGNDRQFSNLCEVLETNETASDPRFGSNPERVKNRKELLHILRDKFRVKDHSLLVSELRDKKVPFGEIRTMDQVFRDPASESVTIQEGKGISRIAFDARPPVKKRPLSPPPEYNGNEEDIRKNKFRVENEH